MKIDENQRKSAKIDEHLRKCAKMWGNLGKPCENQRTSAKLREIPRKRADIGESRKVFFIVCNE